MLLADFEHLIFSHPLQQCSTGFPEPQQICFTATLVLLYHRVFRAGVGFCSKISKTHVTASEMFNINNSFILIFTTATV